MTRKPHAVKGRAKRDIPRSTRIKTGSLVPADWRAKYAEHGGSCGDDLAEQLRKHTAKPDGTIDIGKLKRLGEANGVWRPEYEKLNAGLARMTCGNRLRALERGGIAIKWGRGGRG